MKIVNLALAFLCAFVAQAEASYISEKLYAPAVRKIAVSALSSKCEIYLAGSEKSCSALAKAAVRILDTDLKYDEQGAPAILIFQSESLKLLSDPRLPQFLVYMREQEYSARILGQRDFDFFASALRFFGDEETAVLWVGLLFQDNNFAHHRNWLRLYSNLPEVVLKNYFALYDLADVRNLSEAKKNKMYPGSLGDPARNIFGKKIYYYFLNRILLSRLQADPALKSSGLEQKEMRRLILRFPVFLNLIYAYHHIYHSSVDALLKPMPAVAKLIDGQVLSNAFVEGYGLNFEQWKGRYVDLYMAYLASVPVDKAIPYQSFRERLMLSPKNFLAN